MAAKSIAKWHERIAKKFKVKAERHKSKMEHHKNKMIRCEAQARHHERIVEWIRYIIIGKKRK